MDKPITLCDRCDNVMRCLLNYDGGACRKIRTVKPTNADRLRAMSDEELAETLFDVANYACPPGKEYTTASCGKYPDCKKCWLDWLRQEVQDG